MDRCELVRMIVLNEICDDYENVNQIIFPQVAKQAAKCGLAIERSEIVDALAGLIQDGLAKAYLLSPFEPFSTELEGMPLLDVIEQDFETYSTSRRKEWIFNTQTTLRGHSMTKENCDRTGVWTRRNLNLRTARG